MSIRSSSIRSASIRSPSIRPPPIARFAVAARRAAGLAVAVAMLALSPAALAAALFDPAPSGAMAAPSAPGRADVVRERLVRLDGQVLAARLLPAGAATTPDRAERSRRLPATIELPLFPDAAVVARRTDVAPAYGGGVAWNGAVVGGRASDFATLIVTPRSVTGHVQAGGRTYRIEPAAGGLHRIQELRQRRFEGDDTLVPPIAPERGPAVPPSRTEAKSTIDVLVAYTDRATAGAGGKAAILSDIKLAVAMANKALKASAVAASFRLVGVMPVKYNDAVGQNAALTALTDGTGPFKAVHARRAKVRADLVSLITESGCGLAWVIDKPGPSTSAYGFSTVARSCIPSHAFAHELGHNMGLFHDRFVEQSAPASAYHFGYVSLPAKAITVMAYWNECDANGVDCDRVPLFSSPTKKYKTFMMGIRKGKPGAADAARRLNETRGAISRYRVAQ